MIVYIDILQQNIQKIQHSMTYLYCNDRWKNNDQSDMPGPGEYINQYQVQSPKSNNIYIKSKLMQTIKKKQLHKKSLAKSNQMITCINQEQIKCKKRVNNSEKMSLSKRQQYLKAHNIQSISRTQLINVDLSSCITNIKKQGFNNQKKNKWGNTKLKELLRQMSKTTQEGKKSSQNSIKYNLNTFHKQKRQIIQQERKQLENHFIQCRKGSRTAQLKKRIQKENIETEPQKYQERINNIQRKTVNLQVQPNIVYKTEFNVIDDSRPQTSFKSSQSSFQDKYAYRKESTKANQKTGLQDYSFDEDSIQYIEDATPGPGAYNLSSQNLINKPHTNIEKFGITVQRFKTSKKLRQQAQTSINPVYPYFKKQSKALQQNVGFGKSVKQLKFQYNNLLDNFYEDNNSLQQKSNKLLCKIKNQNICFESVRQRFKVEQKPVKVEDFILQNNEKKQNSQKTEDQKQNKITQKPMNIFLSKVTRDTNTNMKNQTLDVDFQGQNYNCLANKLKRQIDRRQQYEIKQNCFMTSSKRFNYNQIQKDKIINQFQQNNASLQKNELKKIKIEQLRKKYEQSNKPKKGYTFQKQQTKNLFNHNLLNNPSPDKYNYGPSWVKNSFSIRFQSP